MANSVTINIPSKEEIHNKFQKADAMNAKLSAETEQLKNNPNMSREMSLLMVQQFFATLTRRQMTVGREIVDLTTQINNKLITFDLITAECDQFFSFFEEQNRQSVNALKVQEEHDKKLKSMLDDLYQAVDAGTADEGMKNSIKDIETALGLEPRDLKKPKKSKKGK